MLDGYVQVLFGSAAPRVNPHRRLLLFPPRPRAGMIGQDGAGREMTSPLQTRGLTRPASTRTTNDPIAERMPGLRQFGATALPQARRMRAPQEPAR